MKRKVTNFDEVETVLRPYVPLVKELTGRDTVLDRIKPLMVQLGHPEDKLKAIHIAGTSGKTSTAYYISSMLTMAGFKVGLTVSPHIDKINERTQINGQPLNEQDFCKYLSTFLDEIDKNQIKPSYFELIFAFAIWLFAELRVDYAVIETGLGGLYDATNVMTREDKVCVLTDIGYDHMKILGHTLQEIATQKVGIMHEHNTLLMYQQSNEIMPVIKNSVNKYHANLHLTTEKDEAVKYGHGKDFNLLADYQKRNWLLAYYVYRFVAKRDGLTKLDEAQIVKSQQLVIPARMDVSYVNGHTVIMDGAHNYQKMEAFVASYKNKFPRTKPAVLLAFKSDKAFVQVLPLIKDLASEIIVTSFQTSQDLPVKSCDPEDIYYCFRKIGASNVSIESNHLRAYKKLLKSKSKNLVITGSFYLISQIREGTAND
ncbi:MAG: bifunctional folylpolyglutamate synthase/dihydrofolate synthase [Candidatus Saccharimonadales bacterium]